MNALGTSSLPLPGLSATLGLLYQTQHLLSSYPEFGNPQVIPDLLLTGCYNQGNSLNSLLGFPPSGFGSRGPGWNPGVCIVMFMVQVKGKYTGLSSSAQHSNLFTTQPGPPFHPPLASPLLWVPRPSTPPSLYPCCSCCSACLSLLFSTCQAPLTLFQAGSEVSTAGILSHCPVKGDPPNCFLPAHSSPPPEGAPLEEQIAVP